MHVRTSVSTEDNKDKYGAFVPNSIGPSGGLSTFLSYRFFDPSSIDWLAQQRAIIMIHEAVHQIGGKDDKTFGTSKRLSEKIIEKCYPVLKGKLGGVG